MRAEGSVHHEGEEGRDEVRDAENSTYDLIGDPHSLVHWPEVYSGTRKEQEDRGVEEGWEESDKSAEVPPLKCHETDLSPASPKEAGNWINTVVVLREPLLTDHRTEAGTETGGEAGEPKAVDRDRGASGPVWDGWVGYAR